MGDKSRIEWTDASWNPVTGCSHVSAGCEHCYAEALSLRYGWSRKPWTKPNAQENVVLHPERLDQPRRWRQPRRIFVNSMSDLFHEEVPFDFVDRIFEAMCCAQRHVYQVLTKRPERMRDYVRRWLSAQRDRDRHGRAVPGHIWVGVSIEEDRWCGRADVLRQIPARVRFISAEPLLGALPSLDLRGIHWLIVGGESGPKRRPFNPAWARQLREEAQAARVAYFFKQVGGLTSKAGGRLLDGRTWDEMPETRPAPDAD